MKAGFHPLNWRHGAGEHRGGWGYSHPEPAPRQSCVMGGVSMAQHVPRRARHKGSVARSDKLLAAPASALYSGEAQHTSRPPASPGPVPGVPELLPWHRPWCRGTDRGAAAVTRKEIKAGLQNLSF